MHARQREEGDHRCDAERREREPGRHAPASAGLAGGTAQLDRGLLEHAHSCSSSASGEGHSEISRSTKASGSTSREEGPSCQPPRGTLAIADSTTPSASPAANAQSGGPKRTARAATSPFSPSSVPVLALTASPGAAATAASIAIAPTSAKASVTSSSTGTPTTSAPSRSSATERSARP